MSATLVTQRIAFTAGRTAIKKAVSSPLLHSFVGAPVVLHSCNCKQRPVGPSRTPAQQQQSCPHQHQQHTQARPKGQRRGFLRGLKLLCASTVRALPAAGVKAAVLGGIQHLSSVTAFAGLSGAVVAGLALGVAGKGIKHWHAKRRAAKRTMATASTAAATDVTILSFNIRGVMDRWPERVPVLKRVLKQADADVVCFQEVLTGEFGQEGVLLGSSYRVHECRAALQHLGSSSIAGAALSSVLTALLGISWVRSLLVSLPEGVEGWRERHKLGGSWARLLRDLAIVPFYGNSIATRLPATTITGSGSRCWPSLWRGSDSSSSSGDGGTSRKAAALSDILMLGEFRAAQRVCLKLKLSPPWQQEQQQQELSRQELEQVIQQRVLGYDSSSSGSRAVEQLEQQQQQQQGIKAGSVVDVWLVNTHLDHASPETRARQMQAICCWMAPLKASAAAIVITGDLNAPPDEALHRVLEEQGFASTHKVAHGVEPAFTWPSGIIAPLMDDGDPHCADYIYAWQAPGYELQVKDAQLVGDRPSEADTTLYPSDHIGIKVRLRIAARAGTAAAGHSSSSSADDGGGVGVHHGSSGAHDGGRECQPQ